MKIKQARVEHQFQSRSEGLHIPIEEFQYAQFVIREKSLRPPFREWLLSLARHPHFLFWTEKTLLDVFWCQHALLLWKLRGYPDPGEWPVNMESFQQSTSWGIISSFYDKLTGAHRPDLSLLKQKAAQSRKPFKAPRSR